MPQIDISEEAGVRYLHFGSEWVQGAMRIRRPIDLELSYTRDMMAGLLMHAETRWPRHILIIGLGAASLAKFCYWRLPQARITVVEIEPAVVAAARQFFKLPTEDERFRIVIADGAEFVPQDRTHYDYILVDGYDADAKVGALDSLPFYTACWARLSESGLLAANLFGRTRRYGPSLQRLHEAFEQRSFAFPSCESGNVIAFGARGEAVEVPLALMRERADSLQERTGLDLRGTLDRLSESGNLPTSMLRF